MGFPFHMAETPSFGVISILANCFSLSWKGTIPRAFETMVCCCRHPCTLSRTALVFWQNMNPERQYVEIFTFLVSSHWIILFWSHSSSVKQIFHQKITKVLASWFILPYWNKSSAENWADYFSCPPNARSFPNQLSNELASIALIRGGWKFQHTFHLISNDWEPGLIC